MSFINGTVSKILVALSIFLIAVSLYLFTLAPSITDQHFGADSAELIATAHTMGVAHPTGYPTYLLLAKIFSLLIPWGDVAHKINMFSALSSASTVVVVYFTCHLFIRISFRDSEITYHRASAAAIIAAISFAFSPTLWSQSIMAEVYSLNALFTSSVLFLTLLWAEKPHTRLWPLFASALLVGLGMGNHVTLAIVTIPLVYITMLYRSQLTIGTIVKCLGIFLLGLSVYIYLPLRASENPSINWGDATNLEGFLWIVTAIPYRGLAFGLPLVDIPGRLIEWSDVLVRQFNPLGLLIVILGVWRLRISRMSMLVFSGLLFVPSIVFSVMYYSSGASVYLIPGFMIMALWIGLGSYWIMGFSLKARFSVQSTVISFLAIFIFIPVTNLVLHYDDISLRDNKARLVYAQEIFKMVEDNAVILAETDEELFPLLYYSLVEVENEDDGPRVISTRLTQYDWYVRDHHDRYPDVIPALGTEYYKNRLIHIVDFNLKTRPVYITYGAKSLLNHFYGIEEGKLYRILSNKNIE